MKASELIEDLKLAISKYGDLQVAIYDDGSCHHFVQFRVGVNIKANESTMPWQPDETLEDKFFSLR
jgi:hypothetical protein